MKLDLLINELHNLEKCLDKYSAHKSHECIEYYITKLREAQDPVQIKQILSHLRKSVLDIYISKDNNHIVEDERKANKELEEIEEKVFFRLEEYDEELSLKA